MRDDDFVVGGGEGIVDTNPPTLMPRYEWNGNEMKRSFTCAVSVARCILHILCGENYLVEILINGKSTHSTQYDVILMIANAPTQVDFHKHLLGRTLARTHRQRQHLHRFVPFECEHASKAPRECVIRCGIAAGPYSKQSE